METPSPSFDIDIERLVRDVVSAVDGAGRFWHRAFLDRHNGAASGDVRKAAETLAADAYRQRCRDAVKQAGLLHPIIPAYQIVHPEPGPPFEVWLSGRALECRWLTSAEEAMRWSGVMEGRERVLVRADLNSSQVHWQSTLVKWVVSEERGVERGVLLVNNGPVFVSEWLQGGRWFKGSIPAEV